MATIALQRVQLANPKKATIRAFPEAASQSFKAGEFVYLSSGKVTVCASDTAHILGMAMHDASGTTDADVLVAVADGETEFEMNVYHATPGSAITAITQIGAEYGLVVASNKHYLDLAETTADAFQIQSLSPKDAVGDTYGRVIVKVLRDVADTGQPGTLA